MLPWTRGYGAYKSAAIVESLAGTTVLGKLPAGYGFRLDDRIIEYPWVFSQIPAGPGRLLDAGSTLNQEFAVRHPRFSEKRAWITTLAPERYSFIDRGISYSFEDIRDLSFKSGFFDVVTCISTIEHVGLDNVKLYSEKIAKTEIAKGGFVEAVRELHRVLRPGGVLLISMPYGKRLNLGWFQIFDASMLQELIDAFAPSHKQRWFFKYEPDGWRNARQDELKDATYFDINSRSNYDEDFAAASRGLAALRLVK